LAYLLIFSLFLFFLQFCSQLQSLQFWHYSLEAANEHRPVVVGDAKLAGFWVISEPNICWFVVEIALNSLRSRHVIRVIEIT
jgi:hypothetical protein